MASLSGKRVLITRPRDQAGVLCRQLEALGAQPILFPTIQIAPPADPAPLDRAIARLEEYRWVIFTSANGVSAFWERLGIAGKDGGVFARIRVAAIGPATAQALEERGIRPQFIPDEYVAEAIAAGIGDVSGQRILLPRADIARRALADELRGGGAFVEEVTAYRNLPAEPDPLVLEQVRQGVDVITFTSSSTVRNFVLLLGDEAPGIVQGAVVACIGPITAGTARELGLPVHLVAEEYTTGGLVEALETYFRQTPSQV